VTVKDLTAARQREAELAAAHGISWVQPMKKASKRGEVILFRQSPPRRRQIDPPQTVLGTAPLAGRLSSSDAQEAYQALTTLNEG
jgi:hypothetical protein